MQNNINYSPLIRHSGTKTLGFFNTQKTDRELQQKLQALFPNAKVYIPPELPSIHYRRVARKAHIEELARPKSVSTTRQEIELARYKEEQLKQREPPRLEQRPIQTPRSNFRIPARNGPLHQPDSYRLEEARTTRAALQMKQEAQKNKKAFFRKCIIGEEGESIPNLLRRYFPYDVGR